MEPLYTLGMGMIKNNVDHMKFLSIKRWFQIEVVLRSVSLEAINFPDDRSTKCIQMPTPTTHHRPFQLPKLENFYLKFL